LFTPIQYHCICYTAGPLKVSVPLYLTSYAGQLRIFPHLTNAL